MQAYVSNSEEHLRIYGDSSLLPVYVFEMNIYTNISVLLSLCLARDSQEVIKFTSAPAQIMARSVLFNVSETWRLVSVFCNG